MWSECRSDETDVLSNMKGQRGEWKDYSGRQTVLPEYPFLIVVPPTLVEQVTVECTRFLQAGSLDVVKITCQDYWWIRAAQGSVGDARQDGKCGCVYEAVRCVYDGEYCINLSEVWYNMGTAANG